MGDISQQECALVSALMGLMTQECGILGDKHNALQTKLVDVVRGELDNFSVKVLLRHEDIAKQICEACSEHPADSLVVEPASQTASNDSKTPCEDSKCTEAAQWVRRMLSRQVGGSQVTVVDASELHSMLKLLEPSSDPKSGPAASKTISTAPVLPHRPVDSENTAPAVRGLPEPKTQHGSGVMKCLAQPRNTTGAFANSLLQNRTGAA